MSTFTETLPHAGGFLIQEGNGDISREAITIKAGAVLRAGHVLGQITTVEGDGPHVALDPGATDGSQVAAGILFRAVDASGGDAEGTKIARLATVTAAELVWPTGITAAQKATALAELAASPRLIIAR